MFRKFCMSVGTVLAFGLAIVACIVLRQQFFTENASVPLSQVVDTVADVGTNSSAVSTGTTASTDTTAPTDITAPTDTVPTTEAVSDNFFLSAQQEQELNVMLDNFGGKVSAMYIDLGSGYTYQYHPTENFFAASLMKAPYCMYILQLASDGKCDLSEKLTYTQNFKSGGTGIIQNAEFGTQYSIQTLIEYTIRYSDNVAVRMLRSRFPADGFQSFAASLGIENPKSIGYITNARITAEDAAVYMRAIYRFIHTDKTGGPLLYDYMTHTGNHMFYSKYPLVRKYGWADASFHDMAIVEAPRPYILILLSDHEDGTANDFALFRQFSAKIESLSGQS